jgi:hypothetical protein
VSNPHPIPFVAERNGETLFAVADQLAQYLDLLEEAGLVRGERAGAGVSALVTVARAAGWSAMEGETVEDSTHERARR